jgi:hypothetical protein
MTECIDYRKGVGVEGGNRIPISRHISIKRMLAHFFACVLPPLVLDMSSMIASMVDETSMNFLLEENSDGRTR